MTRATLKTAAKKHIKGNIGILFVIDLLLGLIVSALNVIPVVGTLASMLLSSAFTLAVYNIYLNLTNGQKPQVSDLFSKVREFWPAFCVQFLEGLFTMLWSLLLLIPGIVKACAYSQAMYILRDEPDIKATEALKRSQEMMKGHKMEFFKLLLSFFGWALLAPFTLGILYIWLLPYMQATFANYYKYLKGEFVEA